MHFTSAITLAELLACCGSHEWAKRMEQGQPYASAEEMLEAADRTWWQLTPQDWLQAFAAHPRIGESSADASATREQSGVTGAEAKTLARLAAGNRAYEQRFGYTFLISATEQSAEEILMILERRLHNAAGDELQIAADEQRKITGLRLTKLVTS